MKSPSGFAHQALHETFITWSAVQDEMPQKIGTNMAKQ
jgi:hypothetical protein